MFTNVVRSGVLMVLLVFGMNLIPGFACAQDTNGISFSEKSWDELLVASKRTGKPIYIDCYTDWCRPCKQMEIHTFADSIVGQFYNEHFLCYHVDMEKGIGVELSEKFEVHAYPTHLFVNASEEVLQRGVGFKSASSFLELGESALDPQLQLTRLQSNYESGDREPAFLLGYTEGLKKARLDYTEVFDAYLTAYQGAKDSAYYAHVFLYTKDFHSKAFRAFFESSNELYERYGALYLEQRYLNILESGVSKAADEKDEEDFFELVDFYKTNFINAETKVVSEFTLQYQKESGNYEVYYDSLKVFIETYHLFGNTMEETKGLILEHPDTSYFAATNDASIVSYFGERGKGTLSMGGFTPEQGLVAIEYYNATAFFVNEKCRTFIHAPKEYRYLLPKVIEWLDLALLIDKNRADTYGGNFRYLRTYAELYFAMEDYTNAEKYCTEAIAYAERKTFPLEDYDVMVELLETIQSR